MEMEYQHPKEIINQNNHTHWRSSLWSIKVLTESVQNENIDNNSTNQIHHRKDHARSQIIQYHNNPKSLSQHRNPKNLKKIIQNKPQHQHPKKLNKIQDIKLHNKLSPKDRRI